MEGGKEVAGKGEIEREKTGKKKRKKNRMRTEKDQNRICHDTVKDFGLIKNRRVSILTEDDARHSIGYQK